MGEMGETVEEEIVPEEVFLTEDDKKVVFQKHEASDISAAELSSCFSKFSLPAADEGFDRVEFVWDAEDKAKERLREWMLAKKQTERVEDLKPSEWFKEKLNEWTKLVSSWKKKQNEFKDPVAKRKAEAAKKKA